MFFTNLPLISASLSEMFFERPLSASPKLDILSLRFAPPHSTRHSGIGVSPLAQFATELLECYMSKFARLVGADAFLVLKRLPVPSTRECLDDSRCFAAMQVECSIELTV